MYVLRTGMNIRIYECRNAVITVPKIASPL